jgi:DNA-binding CsgD family transcriptional regulator
VLIGRSHELDIVFRHLAESRPLVVVGDAGIGKTTLLREAAHRSRRPVFEGGGLFTLSWMSLLPITRAIGTGLPSGDDATVGEAVRRRVGDGVLILDDLHWADPDTLLLLPLLASRIALLGAVRSDDQGSRRAQASVEAARIELLPISHLSPDEAEGLVRSRRPGLTDRAVRSIIRAAAGNPLLLEELSVAGDPSPTLRVSLAARVQRLSPDSRRSMAVLGLLGRPAPPHLLGPGVRELEESGLIVRSARLCSPRHSLLAETAVRELSEKERRGLHRQLAHQIPEPGEAARHYFAAGDRRQARGKALQAAREAVPVADRARHLELAAQCFSGPEQDHLRIEAAQALIGAGDYEAAERIARAVEGADPEVQAAGRLYRGRALRMKGDVRAARTVLQKGLDFVGGTGSETEVRLRLESVQTQIWVWDMKGSLEPAKEALDLARGTSEEASAKHLLGTVLAFSGSRGALAVLREAIEEARAAENTALECDAALTLAGALRMFGEWRHAQAIARPKVRRARELGLRRRELSFRAFLLAVLIENLGDFARGIPEGYELLEDPGLEFGSREELAGTTAIALVEVGRLDEARELLDGPLGRTPPQLVMPALARAELELASGRADVAISVADEAAAELAHDPNLAFVWVTRGWATASLELPVHPIPLGSDGPGIPVAEVELEAIRLMSKEETADRAAALFDEAARLWEPIEVRSVLRCEWAVGEASLRAGDLHRAREVLLSVEREAQDRGMLTLLARIRASLRRLGVRRSAPRGRGPSPLSRREAEVLLLVGEGRRTREIAARLGLRPSTVDGLIRSAMTKVGARTRIEAAIRAADLQREMTIRRGG